MLLAYVDDSRDNKLACFSAIIIPAAQWLRLFDEVLSFRRALKKSDGIRIKKELHATEFLSGHGNPGAVITKYRRARIFDETMDFLAGRTDLSIINTCVKRADEDRAFERLVDRLQRNATGRKPSTNIMIISDEGKNYDGLVRKMRRHNPILSAFGVWGTTGLPFMNRPITNVVEDIVYRDSRNSFFIQLADFCAYALLRSENPIASKTKYGVDKAFDRLTPVLETRAYGRDPRKLGIIRV